jgi:hypothetical protein
MSYKSLGADVPRWRKYTKTYSQLSVAGLTNDIEVFSLPAKGVIQAMQIVATTAFSGGTIATYTLSIGISGNLVKYCTGFSLSQPQVIGGIESTSGATSIKLAAISTVGLLNAATAGSADVYVLWGILP